MNLNYKLKLPAISVTRVPGNTRPVRQSRPLGDSPTTYPLISDSGRLCSSNQSIPRLNPLLPPLAQRRTVSLETSAVHYHNQQRALSMQRAEHCRRHQVWRKPFYGTSTEKEEYRKHLIEQLQKQMDEKSAAKTLQLAKRAKEGERLLEMDRLALSRDADLKVQRKTSLLVYRDENKRLMELQWRQQALLRRQEALKERELLGLNHINWRGTLS
ncbi:uncharacterized protein LOC114862433 isoform X2 [Betta splendens]|nr:uncharacterized protein LOC114862432 [Betta splendens]XP_029018554.1 uncharacterized protein LOC114862432 [Betta splendens]XP_029018556.1 uncharacterized protein LOC114862433 isoform X2 [Betta splendens]